uniref:Uncharacterized protein n=1 Tax=Proboscia inermis TaxID=420281 RepID=A0A7S0BXI9_9STRA|mmetsp:Transcript_3775/g.4369  ORF Transcript_3775/g.4369 Transcript_3775/m.4369 type:complete len:202 (+) Transcript_3775:72-677(+)|eukprot:CAMPEP_0171305786 /NCGR_PEP_ID=MMETSP0816-20121228/15637_1 /TAXON_ID=420281 /ORGANISM="Proboscia inermis, Strain CCAP1064/1" /LENGTH=201 /DNA_ID=CAMNT_0011786857 /DNA_START=60 /DNA_END=665 /DNA_ORIENTATION=-
MMKLLVLFTLAASAIAFAPRAAVKTGTQISAFENELGAQAPLGFWDPLGFMNGADQERFDRLRFVELKHARVAMLAFLGQVTCRAGYHCYGNIDSAGTAFADIPNGFAALSAVPQSGILQMGAFVGFLELVVMKDITGDSEFIGDFRNGAIDFGWDDFSAEEKMQKRSIELSNGRAAMIGILGLLVHEQIGGNLPLIGVLN